MHAGISGRRVGLLRCPFMEAFCVPWPCLFVPPYGSAYLDASQACLDVSQACLVGPPTPHCSFLSRSPLFMSLGSTPAQIRPPLTLGTNRGTFGTNRGTFGTNRGTFEAGRPFQGRSQAHLGRIQAHLGRIQVRRAVGRDESRNPSGHKRLP